MNIKLKINITLSCLFLFFQLFAREHKEVLLINSYNSRFPTFFQQINGVRSVLDHENIHVDIEFMDSKRFVDKKVRDLFMKLLSLKLSESERYDAVIASDDNAFNFVLKYQDSLFKNIPIVFCGVNNVDKAIEQNKNPYVTGIVEYTSVKETIELILRLFPQAKNIYAIKDSSYTGDAGIKDYYSVSGLFREVEFNAIDLSKLSFEEYKKTLREIPYDAPVLFFSAYHDCNNNVIDFDQSLLILDENLKSPVFHLWEHGLGKGIFGGKMISQYEQGKEAALIVCRILAGEPVASIKVVEHSPNLFMFDYNQLVKYDVNLKDLPKGSVIINKPETFFEKNRGFIIGVAFVFCFLILFIFVLLINIYKRRRTEVALKKQNIEYSILNKKYKKQYEELVLEKKKTEEEERRFSQLFNEHSAVQLVIEYETGIIYDANVAASKFYGWSIEELKEMNINDIDTMSLEEIKKVIEKVDSGDIHLELKNKKANGDIVDVEVFISIVTLFSKRFFYSIIFDISDKKKNEQQIRLLSRSVEQSPVGVIIMKKGGCIEYVNPAFTTISGYEPKDVIGQNPAMLKSSYESDNVMGNLWNTIASGQTWVGEIENENKKGKKYWVNVAVSPIYDKNKEISNFVAVSEDITDKKRIIEDLIIEKEKAEEANRLKTEFLHNMSHEVRTPMNGIIGFSQMLNNENASMEEKESYIKIIQENAYRLLHIIDDILEISRLQANQVEVNNESFCVNALLYELYSAFKARILEKNVSFKVKNNLEDDNSYIITDKEKINKILINLLNNALKFTSSGDIEIGYILKEKDIVFYVKDTGIGILPDKINEIFDRFSQEEKALSRKTEGLGLGLPIARELAHLLGGTLTVESEKGRGSTFYLTVPYEKGVS